MIHLLTNLIGVVAAFVLILAALVYMVSPKRGGEMLRRLGIFLAGALIGTCLLGQFAASLRFRPLLLLLGIGISVAAFVIREARQPRTPRRANQHRGAERTPVMPTHLDDDEDL
jgi:hypothetical protein